MRPFARDMPKRPIPNSRSAVSIALRQALEHSHASRAHQFAVLNELWKQLPERLADEYPSPTHFRRALLIDAGLYNEKWLTSGRTPRRFKSRPSCEPSTNLQRWLCERESS